VRIGLPQVVLVFGCLTATSLRSSDNPESISHAQFCITEGSISAAKDHWMRVDSTKMRAVLGLPSKPEAEIRFRYLGETPERSLLRSGAERTQLGLKLRAQDDCNVVYVMWRINPVSKLVVSVKSNPGQHTHAECENFGYSNMKPAQERPAPKIEEGSEHSLRAVLNGPSLVVYIDGSAVWEGNIADGALRFNGPVGLRSDNARFDFQFFARPENAAFYCGHTGRE
jgi:hypothetical protein